MAVVLITGNPGAGKSELARELVRRGQTVLDADDIAHWEDALGTRVERSPDPMTAEWLAGHRWVWGRSTLAAAIAERTPPGAHLVVCGIALDQPELLDLFDVVLLLAMDDRTQVERLDTPANAGRNAAERQQIIDGRPVFEEQVRAAGAVVLDAREPTTVLADQVLAEVARRFDQP